MKKLMMLGCLVLAIICAEVRCEETAESRVRTAMALAQDVPQGSCGCRGHDCPCERGFCPCSQRRRREDPCTKDCNCVFAAAALRRYEWVTFDNDLDQISLRADGIQIGVWRYDLGRFRFYDAGNGKWGQYTTTAPTAVPLRQTKTYPQFQPGSVDGCGLGSCSSGSTYRGR